MASYTQHKGLELPTSPEHYNIGVFNKNAMVIDSELHKLDIKNQSQDELLATKESLDSETERASTKENQILAKLTAETERAKTAEDTLTSALESEINRALTTEESIHTNLSELIFELTTRLNTLADSDDTTLDQLSEIVAYIKNNKDLIDEITTSKVNVSDIIDNLTSTATDKPLSANQGKILKDLITNLVDLVGDKADKDAVLPVSGGTIESNAEPQLSLKRKSKIFSALLDFENESRKLIQAKGGVENNDPAREAYFSLYDLDADNDKNGDGRLLELLHLSQNLRNIYDSTTNTMKKILVEGEALPSAGGTIQANASPLLILHRQGQYASMDFENNFGKLIRVGVTKGSEAAKPEFHVADVENGTDNAKYLFIISQDKRKIYDKNTDSVQDIATSNDLRKALQFQSGEIFTIKQSTHFAGYCGADGTTVFFTIPLYKNAEERNINISGRFWIREGGSYLVDAGLIQDFSVNIIASGNLLAVDIKKQDSGKFTSKNNVVVMVSGGFTISFS